MDKGWEKENIYILVLQKKPKILKDLKRWLIPIGLNNS